MTFPLHRLMCSYSVLRRLLRRGEQNPLLQLRSHQGKAEETEAVRQSGEEAVHEDFPTTGIHRWPNIQLRVVVDIGREEMTGHSSLSGSL